MSDMSQSSTHNLKSNTQEPDEQIKFIKRNPGGIFMEKMRKLLLKG